MDELDEPIQVLRCYLKRLANTFLSSSIGSLPFRSADQNNIHIGSRFPQIIPLTLQYPCMHPLLEAHAANIQALVFRRGTARRLSAFLPDFNF